MSRSNEQQVAKPGRGGARPGAGRKFGAKSRTPWQRFLDNVEAVATRKFNRKELMQMADNDRWRFIERVALPLAKPSIELASNNAHEDQLPLIFVEDQNAIIGELIEGELAERGIDLRQAVREPKAGE